AEEQRNQAEDERARAETNFRNALQAVEDYARAVTSDKRLRTPAFKSLRTELLNSALNYHRRFIAQYLNNPAAQGSLAAAYSRLGKLSKATGADREAAEALEEAQNRYEQLLRSQPADATIRLQLVDTCEVLGQVRQALGQFAAAKAANQRAL